MAITWLGNGSLPYNTPIEFQHSSWDSSQWRKGSVTHVGKNVAVLADAAGDWSVDLDVVEMTIRPVGGVVISEHADFLAGVVGVVEANNFEHLTLWKQYHHEADKGRKLAWESGGSGPLVTVGKVDGNPVCISLNVDLVGGHRVLFIEATSQVIDWTLINKWLYKNLPSSAYRAGTQYINSHDASNFSNVLPSLNYMNERSCELSPIGWSCSREAGHRGPCAATAVKPIGMQTEYGLHSVACERNKGGTYCSCGVS